MTVIIGLILAIAVFGCSIFVFAESDEASISTGEHFALEPISQSIVPASPEHLVPPSSPPLDQPDGGEDLVFTVRRGDTMRTISHRALSVFLAEQHIALERSVREDAKKILADARASESLRGVKTVTFTYREIADAIQAANASL